MISATDKEGSAAQGVPDPLREPGSGRLGGLLPGHQVRSPDRERGHVNITSELGGGVPKKLTQRTKSADLCM